MTPRHLGKKTSFWHFLNILSWFWFHRAWRLDKPGKTKVAKNNTSLISMRCSRLHHLLHISWNLLLVLLGSLGQKKRQRNMVESVKSKNSQLLIYQSFLKMQIDIFTYKMVNSCQLSSKVQVLTDEGQFANAFLTRLPFLLWWSCEGHMHRLIR